MTRSVVPALVHVRVRVALHVLVLILALPACQKHHDSAEPDLRLPLPALTLPSLGCDAPLESRGECARDDDCGGASCVLAAAAPTQDRESPALSCGAKVGTLAERERCDVREDCESGLCGLAGVCLAPCGEAADCRKGQVCRTLEARVSAGLAPLRACTRAIALPRDVSLAKPQHIAALKAEDVGTVKTSGGLGTSLVYLKSGCEAQPILVTLHARADDQELFDFTKVLNGQVALNPSVPGGRTPLLSILVPNNPAVTAAAQGYELGVFVDRDTSADLVVASRDEARSTLDLNLFFVGGGDSVLSGGFHPGDPHVEAIFAELHARYADIGITLGQLREYDVTGALRDELSVIENHDVLDDQGNPVDIELVGLDRLFQLSAGVDDGGINIFLVSDMGLVLGVSGGIPGALGVHGTVTSGVAVALDTQDQPVGTLMHEISHQMGLFHTSELDGSVVEPLGDTPACRIEHDANGDGVLYPDECEGAGADNLMFWAGVGSHLSAQQREVLHHSLILR
jgi:hypothetical protein